MRFGTKRKERVAGVLENIGVAWILAGSGDAIFTHRASLYTDFVGIAAGLTLILLAVISTKDE